jgi:non-specific serine/threonine protein kinase
VQRGNLDLAGSLYEECLLHWRGLGCGRRIARALAILGWIEAGRGSMVRAQAMFDDCLALRRQLGDRTAIGLTLLHQGWLALLREDSGTARALLTEALADACQHGDPWRLAALLGVLSHPGGAVSPVEHAVKLLAGAELLDLVATTRDDDGTGEEAGDCLSARSLAAIWSDGRGTSIAALVDYVVRSSGGRTWGADGRQDRRDEGREEHLLSPRELQIAELIGRGYTNRQIAEEVVIAERTAETHARNIREKLGLATRTQVAAWAAASLRRFRLPEIEPIGVHAGDRRMSPNVGATVLAASSAAAWSGAGGAPGCFRGGFTRRGTA